MHPSIPVELDMNAALGFIYTILKKHVSLLNNIFLVPIDVG
jgi:hypothetical protein